jgi:glycosyltransferase involved in cell wall biosynthesis
MTMRKLLLVTYHFPPSAASGTFRMLGFARHLPPLGWRVHVIAPPEMPWDSVDPALAAQVPAETSYDPVPYPRGAPRLLRLLAPYGVWLWPAWRACRRAIQRDRPDVVLTSGPPHIVHLLGLALKRKLGLPWIADFRDPWISGVARERLSLSQRWLRFQERRVFARADCVLANAPNAAQLFRTTYPRHADKVVTLTNGFDPPAQFASRPPANLGIQMLHAGEIYAGRDPLPLLDALAALRQAGVDVRLDVMGNVHLPGGDLGTEIACRGLSANVLVRGQLPYQEALQEMAQSDLLVLLDSPGRTIGVPAKLYEYIGAGRPILALAEPDGDTAAILRESGIRHRIAPPKDAGRIEQALRELTAEPNAGPDPDRLHRFTRAYLAGQLAAIMHEVVGKHYSASRSA